MSKTEMSTQASLKQTKRKKTRPKQNINNPKTKSKTITFGHILPEILLCISTYYSSAGHYLNSKCTQYNSAKYGVSEDAIEDISFAMDFPCIDLIEKLHHDKGVEDNGVVL